MTYHIFHKSTNWDSALLPVDDHNLSLLFQFRIFLDKVEPSEKRNFATLACDGQGNVTGTLSGHKYIIDPWGPGEWDVFQKKLMEVLVQFWSNQFELVPSGPWFSTPKGLTAARINCGLSVEIMNTSRQQSHVIFEVFNTRPVPKTIRSHAHMGAVPTTVFVNRTDVDIEVLHWEPHIYRKEPNLTKVNGVPHAVDYFRNILAHEFGHVLELDHVSGRGNDAKNYGSENLDDADTIMGMGMEMIPKYAEPWLKRLEKHLVRRTRDDQSVRFTANVKSPQMYSYRDNGELVHVGGNLSIPASYFGR